MPKNSITVKGTSLMDTARRLEALEALNKEGTTDELVKLQQALDNPQYRAMLKSL